MPKILINILSNRSGGGVSYVRNLIPRLCRLRQADSRSPISILCDERQRELLEFYDDIHDQLISAPTANLAGLDRVRWEKRNLPAIVAEQNAEVLFTPYQVITAKTKARNVIMVRNMEPFLGASYVYGWKGRLRNFLLRRATAASVRSAHRVVAVSHFVSDYLKQHFYVDPSRIICIHHGRDTFFERDEGAEHSKEQGPAPMFFTCGSLLPYRRCENVIDAFALATKRFTERRPTLVVAGAGTEPRYRATLERHAQESGIEKQIQFIGHVSKEEMKNLFHGCTACVLATEIEACPNTAIEALSSGCAIIASDSPPLPEILGDAAIFYPRQNVEKLAEQMTQLLEKPELANKYRKEARNRAKRYDWDTCAQQTFELLASC